MILMKTGKLLIKSISTAEIKNLMKAGKRLIKSLSTAEINRRYYQINPVR